MSGIYIHIPFCRKACHYCNFHFSTNLKLKDQLVLAIIKEIELTKEYLATKRIESIYFGGGTPSVLSQLEINQIISKLSDYYNWEDDVEITLEANPDDLTNEYLKALNETGVNRLSIGIQSFFDDDLIWMNRSHNAEQAFDCISGAHEIGLHNITVDLIFGLPNMSLSKWEENLNTFLNLNVNHISCYGLTVEPKTALEHMVKTEKVKPISDEGYTQHFKLTREILKDNGFDHYEISNYARQGSYAIHNSNYWKSKSYLGLGPSAHSFDGKSRKWNINHNKKYIDSIEQSNKYFEVEQLTKYDVFNEKLMTGLRTKWGWPNENLETLSENEICTFEEKIKELVDRGYLLKKNNRVYLSESGMLISDYIMSELFILEDAN